MKTLRILRVLALAVLTLTVALLMGSPTIAQWVPVTNGQIPGNAVIGGFEANGDRIFIARVNHEGGVHVGKARQGDQTAFIPYGSREISLPNYEVYLGDGSMGRYGRWQPVKPGQPIPANAIQGGNEADGTPLYVARAVIENSFQPGKAKGNAAFIPYGGQERVVNQFDVLVSDQQQSRVQTSVGPENKSQPERYSNTIEEETNGEFCTTRKVDLQESNFERIIIGGILDKTFPGALYMAPSIADGSFVPFTTNPRLPLQLRIDLYGGRSQGSTTTTVNAPVSFGQIQDGILDLIRRHGANSNPARLTYTVRKIDAEEELNIFVGGSYSGFGVSVQATFDYRNKRKKNVILARATQAYFSVSVDNDATLVGQQVSSHNDAAYLSSVAYGRIGYLRIETDESEETIKATLNGSYSGATIEARAEHERILRESTITGFFLGGEATPAARTIGGYDDFRNWLINGARYNSNTAPVPISYKLRYLRAQRDAYVTMTTSYTERNCEKAKYLEVALLGITSDIRQNGMCGTIKVEALETQDGTVNLVKRQVFPEGEPDGTTIIWKTDRARGVPPIGWKQGGVPPSNIQKKFYYYFDPRKVGRNEVKLRLTMNIDAWHKDNDFAGEGWHGMGREQTQEFRLTEALNGNDKIGETRYLVLGPFRSHSRSDREHDFRAIFQIKPAN